MIRLPSLSFRQPIRIALFTTVLALLGGGSTFGQTNADLIYDPLTGQVTLDGSQAAGGLITNFVLGSSGGFINTETFNNPFPGVFFRSAADEISASDPLLTGLPSIDLGMVLAPNLTQADLLGLFSTSTYVGSLGSGVQNFDIILATDVILLGDVNLDGVVDFLDIAPFILLLTNGTFQAEADCDESGAVNFLDISPFIAILSGA